MTPKLPEERLATMGTEQEWGLLPAHRLGTTLRKTMDGRFLVRSMYSYEREMSAQNASALLKKAYQHRFPQFKNHDFEYVWGGTTCLTGNGMPYFGQLEEGIYTFAGCNGAGIIKGSIFGKLLAEKIAGSTSELLTAAEAFPKPNWLPPEPFREIGARFTISMHSLKAGKER